MKAPLCYQLTGVKLWQCQTNLSKKAAKKRPRSSAFVAALDLCRFLERVVHPLEIEAVCDERVRDIVPRHCPSPALEVEHLELDWQPAWRAEQYDKRVTGVVILGLKKPQHVVDLLRDSPTSTTISAIGHVEKHEGVGRIQWRWVLQHCWAIHIPWD